MHTTENKSKYMFVYGKDKREENSKSLTNLSEVP